MGYCAQCRATNKEEGFPRHSQNWVYSVKSKFKIADNQIFCGPWNIKLSDIVSAHLYNVKTFFNIPYCKVLEIKTEKDCFQFGLNPWAKAHEHLTVTHSESNCKMTGKPYSSYSNNQKLLFLFAALLLIIIFYLI